MRAIVSHCHPIITGLLIVTHQPSCMLKVKQEVNIAVPQTAISRYDGSGALLSYAWGAPGCRDYLQVQVTRRLTIWWTDLGLEGK